MKTTFFIVLSFFVIIQQFLYAQENQSKIRSGKIGITFSSFGANEVFRFDELDGAASYDSDCFYTLGINYVRTLNKCLEAETGIEYTRHSIIINPNVPPDANNSSRKGNFSLITIPATLRVNFLKYFFVNGGLIVDIDGSLNGPIDNQTGIGLQLGLSMKYDFDCGVSAFINPYTKVHSLIPFLDRKYHQRVLENGIRIGLTYDLENLK